MAVSYHAVVGGVVVKVDTSGTSSGTLSTLGVPEDGMLVEVTRHEKLVMTDVGGPENPAEIQDMGISARVTGTIIAYDEVVAHAIEKCIGVSAGILPNIGGLIGTSGNYIRMIITTAGTADTEAVWYFPTCKVRTFSRKPSSQYNKYQLEVFAWGFIPAATLAATGIKVYDNTTTV